jgi:2-iminobutanoate/2-iminopropanoate deaminase
MQRQVVSTDKAPKAIGPYSQGISFADSVVFTSGQLPMNPETGELFKDDIKEATDWVMKNVQAVLEAGGSSLDKVLKTTIFLKDMNDFAAMNEVYGKYFPNNPPARSCVQVAKLPLDVTVEIEAIGAK